MNRSTFLALAVAALVAVGAALFMGRDTGGPADTLAGQPLFPGLLDQVNAVEAVTVHGTAGTMTLQRTADGWAMAERDGWPARTEKIRALLLSLAQMETIEPKTAKPDLYADLGVEDPGGKDAKSTGIEALDGEGKPLAALILGGRKVSGGSLVGSYVRKPGEARSWLATGTLDLGEGPADWLMDAVIDVPADDVVRVTVSHPDGSTWTGRRETPEAKHLTVSGITLRTPFSVDDIAGVFADLTLEDVRPGADITMAERFVIKGEFETADGTVLSTRYAELMGEHWVWIDVAGESDQAKAWRDTVDGWAFRIPAFKGTRLGKRLADLEKQPEAAAAPPAPSAPSAPSPH